MENRKWEDKNVKIKMERQNGKSNMEISKWKIQNGETKMERPKCKE